MNNLTEVDMREIERKVFSQILEKYQWEEMIEAISQYQQKFITRSELIEKGKKLGFDNFQIIKILKQYRVVPND